MNLFGIETNPHFLFWIIAPLLPFAFALILFLYYQQRRLAPTKTLLALAIIRMLLLLMIAILFLRPVKTWDFTTTSSGTLWLLVDQSPSMQAADPQSTPTERLHWSEALGYISPSLRKQKLDLQLADTIALQSAFANLRPADLSGPEETERSRLNDFTRQLTAWLKKLDTLRTALDAEPALSSPAGISARDAISRVSSLSHQGLQTARSVDKLKDAAAAVNWPFIDENLTRVINDLATASSAADAEFLRQHATDADVSSALARVNGSPRSDLAWQFLTAPSQNAPTARSSISFPKYRVRIATFADAAQASGAIDPAAFPEILKSALSPAGSQSGASQSTSISAGLQMIAEQIAPDEPASIIIVSDGRHNAPGDPTEPARLLAARGVHVYGLLVGSHSVSPDAAVDQIDAPEWVYKGDTLRAAALIRLDGLAGKTAHVELRRAGIVVDSQNIPITSAQTVKRVNFSDLPPESQTNIEYEVRVTELAGEVNVENNRSSFRVAVKKDKLYALIIEDRPRWEYRYLYAHLERDPRLKVQTVLLDPATIDRVTAPASVKASPANPRPEAQELPQTRDEWQAFDIIILGDIPPDKISATQQQYIAAAVRDKGATLITLAGNRHMPADYNNTPLSELLPVTLAPQFDEAAIVRHTKTGFRPSLAPEGNGSVLGQLGINTDTNADLWSNIPPWYWHSPFTQAKPSASVIWSIPSGADALVGSSEGSLSQARKTALVATMSIGLGKSLYLASDQSWRLRQVFGTNAHERFWNNVLGWAVGSDLPAGGKFVRFGASQPRYAEGQPVEITARILQENLIPYTGLPFYAVAKPIRTRSGNEGAATASQSTTEARFQETETPGYYRATLAGLAPGDFEISLQGAEVERLLNSDPTVTQKTLIIRIVPQLNLERRNMNTDPALLARIAQAGNGFSLDANYADLLASNLPQIQRTHTTTQHIGFFTDPSAPGTRYAHLAFLTLFTLLLTLEWLLRKLAGLV